MICDRIREQIPACLAEKLDPAARQRVIDHLDTCSACRAEVAELGVVWRGLENMREPEPSPAMRARFLETLHAYEEGFQDAQRRQAMIAPQRSWWAGFLPARPAWQAAFSALLLLLGVAGGHYFLTGRAETSTPEIAQLKGQVDNLRQLVTLSLLQEQSPSARLRGVNYTYQITQPDRQVEEALLSAANHDSNVNVRLSAVDALGKFMGKPDIRRALADSITVQDSPLVQIAIIDLLAGAKDAAVIPVLRKVAQDQQLDETVRQRASAAIQKMETAR